MPWAAAARWRPVGDFLRELVVSALRGVTEPIWLLAERPRRRSIQVLADLLDHSAALERVEQAERHALRKPAASDDFAKRQRLSRGSKRRQHFGRVHDRLHEIWIARRRLRLHETPLARSSLRNVSKHNTTGRSVAKMQNSCKFCGRHARYLGAVNVLFCGTLFRRFRARFRFRVVVQLRGDQWARTPNP